MPLTQTGNRTQRIERLFEVSRHLGSSLELDVMLQSVVNAASELTDSAASFILLYEEETDLLKFVAGPPQYREVMKRNRIPLEKSIAGRVFYEGRPSLIPDTRKEHTFKQVAENTLEVEILSLIAVPMVFREETIGVLEAFNRRRKGNYTEDDVTILETLASQAAISILSTLMLEETRRAYEELEELERMKTNFIAIASHELRTPLGLILGHASVLQESVKDPDTARQLETIIRSAARLKKIVEDLSNVTTVRTAEGHPAMKTLELGSLIREIVGGFHDTARKKKVHLATKQPQKNVLVLGDQEKLALAIGNLVENALNFTNKNGHVLVSTEVLPGYARVSVIDDGIGIPAHDLPRVFERFYQVESHLTRHVGGMGLGLAVAKAMVEMHNGQIWVESVEGKGSKFSILLPLKTSPDDTKPKKPPAVLSSPFS
jgi:signal transduction histidine kinase